MTRAAGASFRVQRATKLLWWKSFVRYRRYNNIYVVDVDINARTKFHERFPAVSVDNK